MKQQKTVVKNMTNQKMTYKRFQNSKYIIDVFEDECGGDPRIEMDNLGKMVCFHKRYNLGDKTALCSNQFDGWDALSKHLSDEMDAEVILPLYLYDHSGITISIYPFNDHWDSGQIGFIYATKKAIMKEYNVTEITPDIIDEVEKALIIEVEIYDYYLRGEVYIFDIYEKDDQGNEKEEIIDSVGNIYGDSELKDIIQEAINENDKNKEPITEIND